MDPEQTDPLLDQAASAFGGWSTSPGDINATIGKAAAQYDIPPAVIAGLVQQESSGKIGATGAAGEQGITQFMPTTAKSVGSDGKPYVSNPWNPHESIMGTGKLLRDTMDKQGVDLPTALMMYNAGGDKSKWNPAYAQGVQAKGVAYLTANPGAGADPLLEQAAEYFSGSPQGGSPQGAGTSPQSTAGTPPPPVSPGTTVAPTITVRPAGETPSSAPTNAPAGGMPGSAAQLVQDALAGSGQPAGVGGQEAEVPDLAGRAAWAAGHAPGATPPVAAIPATPQASAPTPGQSPAPTQTPTTTTAPTIPPQSLSSEPMPMDWGRWHNKLNALTLTLEPRAEAAVAALRAPGNFLTNFDAARASQVSGETAYANENPIENGIDRTLGGIPATMLGTGLAGGAVRAGAAVLGRVAPMAEPAINALTEFLSGSGGGGSGVGKLLSNIAGNALQGTTAAGLTSGLSTDPLSDQLKTGAVTSAVLGPLFSSTANSLLPKIDPNTAALARQMEQRGITMPLSVLTKGTDMGKIADAPTADDVGQLTARASQLLGQNKSTVHLSDIEEAKGYYGRQKNLLEPQISIDAGAGTNPGFYLGNGTANTAEGYTQTGSQLGLTGIASKMVRELQPSSPNVSVNGAANAAAITNAINEVKSRIDPTTGVLSGKDYGLLTKQGGAVSDLLSSPDSVQVRYGNLLKDLLNTNAEASSPPGVWGAYKDANQKIAIAHDLTNAAANAGASGILHPGNIFQALKDSPGPESRLLAQAANYYPKVLNATGAPNVRVSLGNMLTDMVKKHGTAAVMGGMTGAYATGVPGEGALLAGIAAPAAMELKDRVVGGMANSPAWRNMLLNMADPNTGTPLKAQVLQRMNQILPDAAINLQNMSWSAPSGAATGGQNQ